jgi:hypothetical protein
VSVEGSRGRVRSVRIVVPRSKIECAYIAGIIDGEGCITRSAGWWVQVGMTHRGVIEKLAEMGGTVTIRPASTRKQEQFIWRVMAQRDVIALLKAILPYLVVKRDRAQQCLNELLELERAA